MSETETAVKKWMVIFAADYLSKANTIEYLQGSYCTLDALIDKGLERHMVGRRAYYAKADINRLIAEM